MKQGIYNWPDLVSGDTIDVMPFTIAVNGVAPSAALSSVRISIYKDGVTAIEKTSGAGITIISAANWQFELDEVAGSETDIAVGFYNVDVETTDADGVVKTYITGNLNILPSAP